MPRPPAAPTPSHLDAASCRGRARSPRQGTSGFSLLELLFVLALVALVTGTAVPQIMTGLDHARGRAAARYLASRFAQTRLRAVARGTSLAIRFDGTPPHAFVVVADGNRNGVRTTEITGGVDPAIEPSTRIGDLFAGVEVAAGGGENAVQFGTSRLATFTPVGTATSGTVYLRARDGSRFAVRVLGATGRTRVLTYDRSSGAWLEDR